MMVTQVFLYHGDAAAPSHFAIIAKTKPADLRIVHSKSIRCAGIELYALFFQKKQAHKRSCTVFI